MRKLIAALILSVAAPLAAGAEALECDLTQNGGWVGDKFLFQIDRKTNQALAYDGAIHKFGGGKPIAANFADEGKKQVFSWSLQVRNRSGQQTKMLYRAVYYPDQKTLQVRASAGGGYEGEFRSKGGCKVIEK